MLCQLVCVDRRYQRMNSFNIRELQSILQRRFFTDLVNTTDHRNMLESLAVTMRFKANSNDFIRPDQSLFYNFGLNKVSHTKLNILSPYNYETRSYGSTFTNPNVTSYIDAKMRNSLLSWVDETSLYSPLKTAIFLPLITLTDFISAVPQLILQAIQILIFPTTYKLALTNVITYFQNSANSNISMFEPQVTQPTTIYAELRSAAKPNNEIKYLAENHLYLSINEKLPFIFAESANTYRFTKFNNPLINYDYKCGHYLTI